MSDGPDKKTCPHRRSIRPFLGLALVSAMTLSSQSRSAHAEGDFDLGLSVRVVSDGCFAGDSCTFAVAITNFGPGNFDGILRLRGRFDGNVRAALTGIGPSGWTCNQTSRDTTCTYRGGGIRAGLTVLLETAYELPTGLPVRDVTYCTNLEWEGYRGGEPSVADIQRALAARGYNPGPVDGVPGFGTRNAIERFQADNGIEVTGWPTPEFNLRLFSGAGPAGDNEPGNDRSCASSGEAGPSPVRIVPDDRGEEELPPDETGPSTEEEEDAAEPQQDAGPPEPAPLPRIHTPRPGAGQPAAAPDQPGEDAAEPQPDRDGAATPLPQMPIHGKQTSEFHRKQLSTQHDKSTSGAIVESKPLAPIAPGQPDAGGGGDGMAEFHQKYKSIQHRKETSTLETVHTKAISSVVHSKARSVITNPQFQGDIHDKTMSAFHKKYRSQSHDTTTSQATGLSGQSQ